MPELPDIQVFSDNLNQLLEGKKLLKVVIVNGKKLKQNEQELNKVKGRKVKQVYRSGKEIRILLSDNNVLGIHLMLTGDLKTEGAINENIIIAKLVFPGIVLSLADRMKNAQLKINPIDKKGIDALDKGLNFKYLKEALNRKTNIKNVLTNQDIIRGIGNSYSDEILWQARISPFSIARAIPEEKIKELPRIIKSVLKTATKKIARKYPGIIYGEVKDFLQVHTKKKTHSPTGFEIKTVKNGMLQTYYTDEQVLYK